MKFICEEKKCTGCCLCLNVCKHNAIKIIRGKVDTVYPIIDTEKCIDCGSCYRFCPSLNHVDFNYPKEAIACWSKDEIDYKTSTSGGAASVISNWVIENGGVAYGCGIYKDKISHIRIDNLKDLWKLKGSKYTQSHIPNDLYKKVKFDLENNKYVVFIGTPCQIAACKAYNRKNIEKLITVDLICHGVPSQNLFIESIKNKHQIKNIDSIDKISFRDSYSNEYYLSIDFTCDRKNKISFRSNPFSPSYKDSYFSSFLLGWSLRKSCYNCIYAKDKRVSDITIGDFWGLNSKELEAKPTSGCSVMLINTEKGNYIKEQIKEKLYIYKRPVEEAIKGNAQLKSPTKLTFRGKLFRFIYPYFGLNISFNLVALDKIVISQIKKIIKRILFINK